MPGRSYSANSEYRYGFNGKEKSSEIYGESNAYDFGARIQDPRLGRWMSVDRKPNYCITPYNFAIDNPITYVDNDGNIQKDSKGNIIFIPLIKTGIYSEATGLPLYKEQAVSGSIFNWLMQIHNSYKDSDYGFGDGEKNMYNAIYRQGYIFTDGGYPILVQQMIAPIEEDYDNTPDGNSVKNGKYVVSNTNNDYWKTNCYGRSLTGGKFYISDGAQKDVILDQDYMVVGKPGGLNDKTSYQTGDVLKFGGDHYIVATGQKGGKTIWSSQFSGDPEGNVTGDLKSIIKDLRSKYQGQEDEFDIKKSTLFRKKGPDAIQPNGQPASKVPIPKMIKNLNNANSYAPSKKGPTRLEQQKAKQKG